jgi:hypothetical protein
MEWQGNGVAVLASACGRARVEHGGPFDDAAPPAFCANAATDRRERGRGAPSNSHHPISTLVFSSILSSSSPLSFLLLSFLSRALCAIVA